MPSPAERALGKHRSEMRDALVALFEVPVPEGNKVGREVLTIVMGNNALTFDKPILDFVSNQHLSALTKPGVSPVVWEKETGAPWERTRSSTPWRPKDRNFVWNF